jgi:hypothetical protein
LLAEFKTPANILLPLCSIAASCKVPLSTAPLVRRLRRLTVLFS